MRRSHLLLSLLVCLLVLSGCGKKKTTAPTWFTSDRADGAKVAVPPPSSHDMQSRFEQQRWELRNRVAELERKVEALDSVLNDLGQERSETVRKLRNAGVISTEDLKNNPLAQTYARNLHQVRQEIDLMEGKVQLYRVVLEEGNAVLRRVERHLKLAQAGIADEEILELTTTIRKIDERMQAGTIGQAPDELGLEAVLEQELRRGF